MRTLIILFLALGSLASANAEFNKSACWDRVNSAKRQMLVEQGILSELDKQIRLADDELNTQRPLLDALNGKLLEEKANELAARQNVQNLTHIEAANRNLLLIVSTDEAYRTELAAELSSIAFADDSAVENAKAAILILDIPKEARIEVLASLDSFIGLDTEHRELMRQTFSTLAAAMTSDDSTIAAQIFSGVQTPLLIMIGQERTRAQRNREAVEMTLKQLKEPAAINASIQTKIDGLISQKVEHQKLLEKKSVVLSNYTNPECLAPGEAAP